MTTYAILYEDVDDPATRGVANVEASSADDARRRWEQEPNYARHAGTLRPVSFRIVKIYRADEDAAS